jgi:hypothetical protein
MLKLLRGDSFVKVDANGVFRRWFRFVPSIPPESRQAATNEKHEQGMPPSAESHYISVLIRILLLSRQVCLVPPND